MPHNLQLLIEIFVIVTCGLNNVSSQHQQVEDPTTQDKYNSTKWPYLLRLEGEVNCAATALSYDWLLTAASCFMYDSSGQPRESSDLNIQNIEVATLGAKRNLNSKQIYLQRVITHPEYRQSQSQVDDANDIALVQTSSQLEFLVGNRDYAELNTGNSFPSDDLKCVSLGTGCFSRSGQPISTKMVLRENFQLHIGRKYVRKFKETYWSMTRETNLEKISSCECRETYNTTLVRKLCAVTDYFTEDDECFGDFGGPLMCERDGQWLLTGILSYRSPEDDVSPMLFSRVSHFYDWIYNIVNSR